MRAKIKISPMRLQHLLGLIEMGDSLSAETIRFMPFPFRSKKGLTRCQVIMSLSTIPLLRKFLIRFFPSLAFTLFVATDKEKIVGLGWLTYGHDAGPVMCIADDYQNRGIGTMLLKRVIAAARVSGLNKLLLSVNKKNTRGIHFYKKFGFRVIGKEGQGLVMQLDLHSPRK